MKIHKLRSELRSELRRFLPAERVGELREIVPLTRGLSGAAVYSVTTTTGDFILRIHRGDRTAWDQTLAMQRLAAEHGVAPELVYVDEEELVAVSVKASGVTFVRVLTQPAVRPAAFVSLLARLRRLHAIPTTGLRIKEPVELARSVWEEQVRRPGFPRWALPLGERITTAGTLIAQDGRTVFSHCDLHPANLIWDGTQVWFIDWEAAGLAHPYRDLATIANFLLLPDTVALGLLAEQEQAPIDASQQLIFAALRELDRITYGGSFFRLVPDLTTVPITDRAAMPTLGQCYDMMANGTLMLSESHGQALFGAALLRECE